LRKPSRLTLAAMKNAHEIPWFSFSTYRFLAHGSGIQQQCACRRRRNLCVT
jgi:hypothetical protein